MVNHTCAVCGAPFTSRTKIAKYCSDPCKFKAYTVARIADGRLADYRAKNRDRRNTYNKTYKLLPVSCSICGVEVERKTAYKDRQFVCSYECRAYLRFGKWPSSEVPWQHPIRSTRIPLDHPVRAVVSPPPRVRFVIGTCLQCGLVFTADRFAFSNLTDRTCSPRCSKRHNKQRRRATGTGKLLSRHTVFVRDGWTCLLCGSLVNRDAVVPHPMAATIDHVIPLARGGKHVLNNVQTAHFICNARKGDRVV